MSDQVDHGRRKLLTAATAVTGAIGAGLAVSPFLASWKPSARAKALGAPVEIDISKLESGAMVKVEWRGKPVYVVRRSKSMVDGLAAHDALLLDPGSDGSKQPAFAKNPARASNPEFLVVLGVCTHLGCAPLSKFEPGEVEAGWPGGFYCPCHGSKFDMSGRVYKGVPAPTNLEVPPYSFVGGTKLLVGADSVTAA
jgi:ubiquinol-cytochrome c reductase iron-sulfur subunit